MEIKKTFKITINGKDYSSPEEVPEEFRHIVDAGMAAARTEAAKDPLAGAMLKAAGEDAGPAGAAPVVLTPVKKQVYFNVSFNTNKEPGPENGAAGFPSPAGPEPLRPAPSFWTFVIIASAAALAVLLYLKK